jgi:hypothetical protein
MNSNKLNKKTLEKLKIRKEIFETNYYGKIKMKNAL